MAKSTDNDPIIGCVGLLLIVLLVGWCTAGHSCSPEQGSDKNEQPPTTARAMIASKSETTDRLQSPQNVSEAEKAVKLIINLNHRLCAKITFVEPTSQDSVFHVRCIKNIGGRQTIDYLVDATSNAVIREP